MNTPPDYLSEVLRGWRVKPPADPNFRHVVWQRIGGQSAGTWAAYLRAHTAAWLFAAVLTLGATGLAGRAIARMHIEADREAIAVTYLMELDPRVQAVLKP